MVRAGASAYAARVRAPVRVLSCSLLCAAFGLASPVASAGDTEQSYRDLEARTRLDLDGLWREYQRKNEARPFEQFVEARYIRRRDTGRGLVFGGAGVGILAWAAFFLALPRSDAQSVTYASYAGMGVAAGMMIAGGVLWGRNFRRLERLEDSGMVLGSGGRLRLRAAGPIALPRGAGVSLGFAF